MGSPHGVEPPLEELFFLDVADEQRQVAIEVRSVVEDELPAREAADTFADLARLDHFHSQTEPLRRESRREPGRSSTNDQEIEHPVWRARFAFERSFHRLGNGNALFDGGSNQGAAGHVAGPMKAFARRHCGKIV
jgi:hypothetical protein